MDESQRCDSRRAEILAGHRCSLCDVLGRTVAIELGNDLAVGCSVCWCTTIVLRDVMPAQ